MARQLASDAIKPHERRVADEVEQRVGDLHRRPGVPQRAHLDPGRSQRGRIGYGIVRVDRDGNPSRCNVSAAAAASAARPVTATSRGIRGRRSATSDGGTSADGIRTTWFARASSRSGGEPSPRITSTSTR
ncbi:MAG: hypothetical protein ACXVEX_04240 [Actinomycetota bacterium]